MYKETMTLTSKAFVPNKQGKKTHVAIKERYTLTDEADTTMRPPHFLRYNESNATQKATL